MTCPTCRRFDCPAPGTAECVDVAGRVLGPPFTYGGSATFASAKAALPPRGPASPTPARCTCTIEMAREDRRTGRRVLCSFCCEPARSEIPRGHNLQGWTETLLDTVSWMADRHLRDAAPIAAHSATLDCAPDLASVLAAYATIRAERDNLAGTVELCCAPVEGEASLCDRIRAAGDAQRRLRELIDLRNDERTIDREVAYAVDRVANGGDVQS